MSVIFEWWRDVPRYEQVRAAEDAAAVPSIQHRDLPEIVADLRERVAELTTKHNALADLARLDAGWLKANEQRLAAELDAARARVAELEAAPAASGAAVGTCNTFCGERECERTDPTQCKRGEPQPARGGLTAEERESSAEAMKCMTKLRRERDAAQSQCEELERAALVDHQTIGTLRARVAELEGDRRPATWQEEEAAVEGAWLLCGLEPDWPSDEPGTIVRHAESMRREVGRLRARVAELEAERDAAKEECGRLRHLLKTKESECETHHPWVHPSAAPAANAGGEDNSEPVAWGVLMTPGSKVWRCSSEKQAQKCVDHFGTGTVVPLYAAPQPPRGWLTEEERKAVQDAADRLHNYDSTGPRHNARVLRALLARSTPPKVKVPNLLQQNTWQSRDSQWIAAIREAGGEVEG